MNYVSITQNIQCISEKSKYFDKLFSDEPTAETIKEMTQFYMKLRIQHGILLAQLNKLNNKAKPLLKPDTPLTEEVQEMFYSISTFNSLIDDVTTIINNIDYQFKQTTANYPRLIKKHYGKIVLFVSNENDGLATILNEFRQKHPEHEISISTCSIGDNKECGDVFGKNFSIHFKSLPMMFLTENNTITELPIENIHSVEDLEKVLE